MHNQSNVQSLQCTEKLKDGIVTTSVIKSISSGCLASVEVEEEEEEFCKL